VSLPERAIGLRAEWPSWLRRVQYERERALAIARRNDMTFRNVVAGSLAALALTAPAAALAAQARTVELSVTAKGFEPSRVKLAKGEPVKLVVTRKTDDTCAKQMVIPDENIKADLPLNKPVTLSFTPKRSGDIRYTCGMNMISGVLEVASSDGSNESEGMGGGGMMGGGMMGGSMEEMSAIHRLLADHEKIRRTVKDIPNGVETATTSADPNLTALIREHVRQMKSRLESGEPIRQGDPLFREIFANHEHIHMSIEDVPGGARVTETADEPRVVPLVRQHARRAVSEFVAEGMPRAMRPTPLPPGYTPSTDEPSTTRTARGCRWMSST
jgi:plastocyanin